MTKKITVVLVFILCILVFAFIGIAIIMLDSDKREPENVSETTPAQTETETETEDIVYPETEYTTEAENIPEVDPLVSKGIYSIEGKSVLADNIVKNGVLGSEEYPLLSPYGPRDTMGTAISSYHRGIDFSMKDYTPLCAPMDTIISYVGENDVRGKWLVMYLGKGIYLEYQHCAGIYVKPGEFVKANYPIAVSGSTGTTIMEHLHLEILISPTGKNDVYDFEDLSLRVDPAPFLSWDVSDF